MSNHDLKHDLKRDQIYTPKQEPDLAVKILIEPGSATPEEIGEYLAELSLLYRMLGGSGIGFRCTEIRSGMEVLL